MAFQQIVDTYGVPQYKEANPAVLTIVTFPFLFAVMFGDLGHGSILLFFALYLTLRYESFKDNKVLRAIGAYRYLLLLMGIMACYCGTIYNDFFALQMNLFNSCYQLNNATQMDAT